VPNVAKNRPEQAEIASEQLYHSVERILQKCLQQELPPSEGQGRELLEILTGLASFEGHALRLTMVSYS
jgi:hypothetical protein